MKKETASAAVRLYPSTRRALKIEAAKNNTTIAEMVERKIKPLKVELDLKDKTPTHDKR